MLIIVDLVYNLSLLVALSVVSSFIGQRWRSGRRGAILQGVLFGTTTVIGMLHPLVLSPGLIFDGRSVMISLCGLFFGPVAVGVTGLMAAACRVWLGGSGMTMGLLVILSSSLLGMLFHARRKDSDDISASELFVFGLIVHFAMLAMTAALPTGTTIPVLRQIGFPVLLTYPLATVLVGKILSDHRARLRYVRELWESKEEFRTTLYSIGDAVITTDVQGRVVHMNPVAQHLTGWPETEAQGRFLQDVFRVTCRDTGALADDPATRVLQAGHVIALANTTLTARDGGTRSIIDSGAPIRDAHGAVTGVVLVFRDETAELAAEAAQRESERLAQTTVDALSAQIAILDETGRILRVNQAWRDFADPRHPGDANFGDCGNYLDVCDRAQGPGSEGAREFGMGIRAVLRGERREFAAEYPYNDGGDLRWFQARVTRFSGDGPIRVVVAHEEITQRKEAEAALLAQREELRHAHQILSSHLQNSPLGVIEWDADFRVIRWSQRAVEIFGWPEGQVLHKRPQDWKFIHDDDATQVAHTFRALRSGNTPRSFVTNRNFTLSGNVIYCEWYNSTLLDEEGQLISIFSLVHDVTPRITAEQAVQASEKKYRNLVEMTHDVVWALDAKGRIMYISPATRRVFGREPEEMIGRRFHDFVSLDQAQRTRAALDLALASGESSFTFEYRAYHTDGYEAVLIANATLLRDDAGRLTGLVGTSQDITDRKRTEDALRDSESRHRGLFENAPVGIFTTTSAGAVRSVNPAMTRMLGWSSPEEALQRLQNLSNDLYVDPARRDEFVREIRETGHVSDFEYQGRRADGQIIWLSMNARVSERYPDGTFLIEGFTTDVTERKAAEDQLRSAKNLLEKTLSSLSEAVLVTNATTGEILECNAAVEPMFGYAPEELIGRGVAILHEDVEAYEAYATQCGAEADESAAFHTECRMRRKDGTIILTENTVTTMRDEPATGKSIVTAVRDITERKQAQDAREQLEAQLRQAQKMEAVGRLAGGVAHDFNNMLGVILGHAEMAAETLDPANPLRGDVEQIVRAARRSAELTRQLLAFARKQTIAPKVLDLNDTVARVLKMLGRLLGEDIELDWLPGNDTGRVKMDPTQIDQILANLTVNARDAIGGVGRIAIETSNVSFDEEYCHAHPESSPGRYVLITVSDNGSGMDKQTVERLFEPFFTTKVLGEGTGLGLATVYGIVKQNGGFINVYSEVGTGTTFNIYLPREFSEIDEPDEDVVTTGLRSGFETVLVVEDEPALLTLAELSLKRLGYTVLTAASPTEAITLANEYSDTIDVLVTDVVMPVMSGWDVWRHLSASRPNLRCMFMSGYTADVIAHSGVLDEGVHFLQKPFSVQALAEKLRDVLDE